MDVFEKLEALKARFRANLGPRIETLIDSADQITLHSDQAKFHTYLEGIYTEAHNLAGSAKPFGYVGISDIAARLQSVTLDVLSSEPTSNDERLLIIKAFIGELETEAVKDNHVEVSIPGWKELSTAQLKESPDVKKTNIILVDDDEPFATQLSAQLEEFGFDVILHPGMPGLKELIASSDPAAVIMDVVFPEGSSLGFDVVNILKEQEVITCPVVFLSFRDDIDARLSAVRAGADGYFTKPLIISEFINFLERMTHRVSEDPFRVVVIDDDKELSQLNALALQQAGVETLVINDPMDVIASISIFKPDILLMDIQMPKCNGFELAKVIRQDNKFISTPIIFLTDSESDTAWNQSMIVGGDEFLTKDISIKNLTTQVVSRAKRIREQNLMANRLAEKTARYDALVDTAQDGFVTTDDKHRILSWSKGAEKILGYSEQEIFGKSISVLYPETEKAEFESYLAGENSDDKVPFMDANFESIRIHKNGHHVPVEISLSQWTVNDEKFTTGIYRDISKRIEIEQQLQKNMRELEFQKLSLDEHAIVSITNIKGDIIYVNNKFCDISGYNSEELIGQNHRMLSSGEHSEAFFKDLWKTIANGKIWHGTIKNLAKNGGTYSGRPSGSS